MVGSLAGRPPKRGLLLGSREYKAYMGSFKAGEVLRITARISFRDDSGFGAYDCSITGPSGEAASATLKVFEPPDFEAFIKQAGLS
jgi:predicted hotdog family 3-hydroxylacyl-ACP dehydratase